MQVLKKCVFAFFVVLTIGYLYCFYQAANLDQIITYSRSIIYQKEKSKNCEVIHIGIVCTGYNSTVGFHTMLKSIYFYRSNPIHFHIMVDEVSENILKILFESWAVPQVKVNFYNINDYVESVKWIPNKHYSGIYGLLKLMFPTAISTNVTTKLIVLDTDLTFLGDIYNLWNIFEHFDLEQVIGLVEHQNDYYLGKLFVPHPWPALQRGFNTGVILYHIERLQTIDWNLLWTKVTRETLLKLNTTHQADQDIINAVIKKHSQLIYFLPCEWNIQLTNDTESHNCYNNNKAQVLHWNSPYKTNVANRDGDSFRSIHKMFLEYNGDLMRRQLSHCLNETNPTMDLNKQKDPDGKCYKFVEEANLKRRTILYFRDFKYVPSKNDVTFVSQLSFDRLYLVEELSKLWDGPMSLTIYVTDSELHECITFIGNSTFLQNRFNIAYHAVFKDGEFHPINVLRNVALHNVKTPYVFLVDIDFLPMPNLYSTLKTYLSHVQNMEKKALIVPAFETNTFLPETKNKLLEMMDNGTLLPFHQKIYRPAHAPTNFEKWRLTNDTYQVLWKLEFEPYIVVTSNVTEYDERFLGYGWNKVSHIFELKAQGYDFLVLPNAYIVHKAHKFSNNKYKFINSLQGCLHNLKSKFMKEINKKYPNKRSIKEQ